MILNQSRYIDVTDCGEALDFKSSIHFHILEEQIFKFCSEHFPQITVFAVILVIAIWLTYRITKGYNFWVHKIKATEIHANKIDAEILPKLNEISGSLNGLMIYLKGKDKTFDTKLFMSKSPIRLTELGWKILNAIGGKKYIDDNKQNLIERMNKIGIKTALDSQINAPSVILEFSNDDSFKDIKDYVYNNPIYKEKTNEGNDEISVVLSLDNISNIMGIYLRDVYLETRPDLNVDDI